ncbi:NUDIX hydrolase [Luteimicrobium subarcticum]|uniref:NUDIX domain-containing protein n=1 Tax=Luteimicrobium subarcticum TaxID=620910 RepID=A0A2M8W452_9MICO|nr:NUDIX domain-containing protein [Luteimicrobium subarcticum]
MASTSGVPASPASARDALARLVDGGGAWTTPWRHAVGALDPATARDAAVLVLFGVLDGAPGAAPSTVPADARTSVRTGVPAGLDVLLLARAATLGSHPGQVAFPGGRVDPGDDGPVACALREATEETGLDASGVDVLGTYDPLPLPVSNHLVTPVLGWWARRSPVRVVDPGESAHVFSAPVAGLIDPERRRTVEVRRGNRRWHGPGFLVADGDREHVVWGFTAGILDALLDELGWTQPWDRDRVVPAPL